MNEFSPPRFSVSVDPGASATSVVVEGEIDIATVDEVREALATCTGDVVLDLGGVAFLDTSALRLFVEQQRKADAAGSRFALARVSPHVMRLLEIAGLHDRLEVVDGPGDAPPAG